MTTKQIYEWLCSAPMLADEKVNLDYLPTYEGWSMTMPRRGTDTDILGNAWESVEINITRRKSISGNEDRLAIADELDKLRFWAKQNPPDGVIAANAQDAGAEHESHRGEQDCENQNTKTCDGFA